MDARDYFLMLLEEAHWTGKARRVFGVPTPAEWRAVLPGRCRSWRGRPNRSRRA